LDGNILEDDNVIVTMRRMGHTNAKRRGAAMATPGYTDTHSDDSLIINLAPTMATTSGHNDGVYSDEPAPGRAEVGGEDLSAFVPGAFDGAFEFCCMANTCVLLFCLVPLAVLLPLYLTHDDQEADAAYVMLYSMVFLLVMGVFCLLFSLSNTLTGGTCCKPPPPARSQPLINAHTGAKTHGHVQVRNVVVVVNPFGANRVRCLRTSCGAVFVLLFGPAGGAAVGASVEPGPVHPLVWPAPARACAPATHGARVVVGVQAGRSRGAPSFRRAKRCGRPSSTSA